MIIWWRRTLIAVSAAAAVLASFVFLRDLAIHAGWPAWTAPLLPLSLDALAAAALTEYRRTRSRTAAAVSVGAIAGSVAGNATSHLISTDMLEPGWAVVTAVGSVPAITVGLVVHIFTARGDTSWAKTPDTATETTSGTATSLDAGEDSASASSSGTAETTPPESASAAASAPPPPAPPAPALAPAPAPAPAPSKKRRSDTELLNLIHERGLTDATLTKITSELNVSKTRAQRLRTQLTEKSPHPRPASRSDQEPAA